MEVELIRDETIGTPAMLYAKLRSGPMRIGSTPFCAIYETAGAARTLIMRRDAGSWVEAKALASTPRVALYPDGAYLQYAYSSLIEKMDEGGAIVESVAGPAVGGLYYPHSLARLPNEDQRTVLYEEPFPPVGEAVQLWREGLVELAAFPPLPEGGSFPVFPVGCALDSNGGLHMAAAAGSALDYVGTVWYRAYVGGILGTIYTIRIGTFVQIAAPSVTSDGRIYVPLIVYDGGIRNVKVAVSTVAAPEIWTEVDLGTIVWDAGIPDLVSSLAPDGKTLHLFWTEDPNGDGYMQDCYESHGASGVFSAPAKLIGIDEFPVIQDQAVLHVEGAGVVASNKIGLLFSAGNGIADVWHTFYGEIDAAAGSGARYRGWVM